MVVVIVLRLSHVLTLWWRVSYGSGYNLEAATCINTVAEGKLW